MAGCDIIM